MVSIVEDTDYIGRQLAGSQDLYSLIYEQLEFMKQLDEGPDFVIFFEEADIEAVARYIVGKVI